ncbi:MAG TPA: pitrilysin family protein [Cyclobacteriaceae bacterium]|nr:insulinase family protein [Cyclobacteriaceae bacterium]HMV07409.1 pitrilysin family protein [Cyclobacteriaceae bacterium]HMV88987.1 pitrilysin family protein [Cyclobacteriaceae bacterium]HMW99236.1 pitrilysin family protein [Cyclobacteriaceae bacterium]HMX48975.1 pitrilysin family protein [Cyclobacteriaceae bacterium]
MLDRTVQPAFQKSAAFDLIRPETIALKNGIPVIVVRGGDQAVVKIEFVFDAGKWDEPQPGVSYFTAHLLQKGTASRNSYEISNEAEKRGIHFEVSPGHDFTSLALFGLTKNIGEIFELTREIITAPVFPQYELDQMRAIYTQSLKINLEKTSYIASLELRKKLFGSEHPYGRDAGLDEINALDRDWLLNFHRVRFGNFRIICSGKITDELLRSLISYFETVDLHTAEPKTFEAAITTVSSDFIEKESSVQSSLRLGRKAVDRLHPDYAAVLLLNHIFGGYFGSRLMKNIREEKGLTYGISSSVAALKRASYITVGTDVNKENREIAMQEIKNEMTALCDVIVGKNELEISRNHFIGSLQSEITTPFAHADKIKNLTLFGLPADYYQQLIHKIDALTAADLQQAANTYLSPQSFTTVAVG